jgi:hypothetical protein
MSRRPLSSARLRTGATDAGSLRIGTASRPASGVSRPGTQANGSSRPSSSVDADSDGRRRRALRSIELKNEIDDARRLETVVRQRFDLRLAEVQLQLRQELSRLRPDVASALMQGQEDLLEKPDFSQPRKWEQPASFAEIFEQNPGYRPTPRDKKSAEWTRLFGARV